MKEILDSNVKDYHIYRRLTIIFIIVYNTLIPYLVFVISPMFGLYNNELSLKLLLFFMVTTNFLFLYILYDFKRKFTPAKYVKLTFTDNRFNIFIQNRLYFQQNSNELKTIEIVKNKYYPDYDLIFIETATRTIRLTLILVHEDKIKEVLEIIRKWGEDLYIPVNFREIKKFYSEEYEKDKKLIEELFKVLVKEDIRVQA